MTLLQMPPLLPLLTMLAAAQTSPCDLNADNIIDAVDVQLAVAMKNGARPCRAAACDTALIERVRAASIGGACVQNRSVVLTWTASTSSNVTGYYIYRGAASKGPYTKLNTGPVSATTYTDNNVEPGKTYYYVATAVNAAKQESAYSNEATAIIPRN